jgi:hypothetical protein
MGALNSKSPYTDDIDDRQGRVALCSTPETWYNTHTTENPGGADASVPYPNEMAHTDEGDFVVMMRNERNEVVAKSASRDLRNKIEGFERRHIFENAEAFTFNNTVNTLFFDSDRMTVKISPERVFSSNYHYWAVKGIKETDGSNGYFTGITENDGGSNIISNLVNTDIKYDEQNNPIGVTCSGHLISPLVHGHNYIVQFFDEDRILVDQMSFQAYSVRNMTFDIVPENAIVDIKIGIAGNSNIINLQQDADWRSLNIRLYLLYADGSVRDVTSEWVTNGGTTGRVIIDGLDNINSQNITPDGESGYEIKVHYFASSTNIDNPMIDPDNLVITHTYEVKIVPNSSETIAQVIPSLWIEGSSNYNARICMKLFGLNRDDSGKQYFVDHTYRLRNDAAGNTNGAFVHESSFELVNENDPNKIYYKLNGTIASTEGNTYFHVVPVKYGTLNATKKYGFKTNAYWSDNFVKFASPVETDNPNNLEFSPVFKASIINDIQSNSRLVFNKDQAHTGSSDAAFIDYLKNRFKITVNGHDVVPTHIRIRNGKIPTFWHVFTPVEITESNLLTNGILYNQSNNSEMTYVDNKTPLIVEFINKSMDENNVVTINVTGLALFFVDTTSN